MQDKDVISCDLEQLEVQMNEASEFSELLGYSILTSAQLATPKK